MRTLQASLDLNDDGDKVIFRQFGGESSLRTLQSGHTRSFVPTNLIPIVGSSQKSQNCVRTTTKDAQQITCQSSLICTRDPDAWTTIHQQETMTQHPHAVADHGTRQHQTATDLRHLIRPILRRLHLGSRKVNTRSQRYQSRRDSTAWNTVDDQTVETTRALHGVRAMRGTLRHPVSGISDVDPNGTIGGHPACIASTGAQEEQCCELSGGPAGARQSLTERQSGNNVEEGAERLRSSTDSDPEERQRCDVLRMCGNRLQRTHLTMVARDPETKLNNRTVLASTGKRPVEIERPFCPHGPGSVTMQATPQQSLYWECSTCSTISGLSLDGCDVRLADQRELRGCRREHGSHWRRRDTVPLKVQGQLKGVDQEVYLQLIYESGQRPENQVPALGLVSRHKVELGEQVTESFNPEGFFNCMVLDSQPTKSVPRRGRLAIERKIDEMCRKRNPQSRLQHENLDVRSIGTTRPLRLVALFDDTCDLTDEDAREATVRACRSVKPGIITLGIPRTVSRTHLEFCITLCTWQHERGALYIMILTDSEDALSEEQYVALKTLQRNEGSTWLGEIGARLDSNLPASSRARVWTNSRWQNTFNKKR